jgi:hypothetical protein
MGKYVGTRSMAGADVAGDAREVLSLVLHLGEHGAHLVSRDVPVVAFCTELRPLLRDFEAARGRRQVELGSAILFRVNDFAGQLARVVAQQQRDVTSA